MSDIKEGKPLSEKVIGSNRLIIVLVTLAEVCGIISLALLVHWLDKYYEGYSFHKDDSALFSYHLIFMQTGMIFLFGNSIVVFRFSSALPVCNFENFIPLCVLFIQMVVFDSKKKSPRSSIFLKTSLNILLYFCIGKLNN